MEHVNEIFDEAEALNCRAYTEGCLACMTGYLIHLCRKTHYEKVSSGIVSMVQGEGVRRRVRIMCMFQVGMVATLCHNPVCDIHDALTHSSGMLSSVLS